MESQKFISWDNLNSFWIKIKLKLENKVDKVDGLGLSTNDFTNEARDKLAAI